VATHATDQVFAKIRVIRGQQMLVAAARPRHAIRDSEFIVRSAEVQGETDV